MKSHPQPSDVVKSDLDKYLPNIQDIQCAFVKVRQICVVGEPVFQHSTATLQTLNPCEVSLHVHFLCVSDGIDVLLVSTSVSTVSIVCRTFRGV